MNRLWATWWTAVFFPFFTSFSFLQQPSFFIYKHAFFLSEAAVFQVIGILEKHSWQFYAVIMTLRSEPDSLENKSHTCLHFAKYQTLSLA